jgi:beta-N-acetylhexosaminidase
MALGPVMLDLHSSELDDEEKEILTHPRVGGVILFARNYQNPQQLRDLVASIRAIRSELLIAVDQEGGRVQRFKEGFTRIPAMQQFLPLYRKKSAPALALVKDCAWLMATELLAVGIDFSFAPVLDVDDNQCEVIANRAFSPEPDEVVALAGAWVEGMHEAGMPATGKHFPGHGAVIEDSHEALPVDSREYRAIACHDLIPFKALQSELDAIMPAHILFSQVDPDNTVGFSAHWLKTRLRDELQYKGVIFSDDLTMAGAAMAGTFLERAQLALAAGCNMVLVCNDREGALEILTGLEFELGTDAQNRLSKMRFQPSELLVDYRSSSRWRLTRELLQTFN